VVLILGLHRDLSKRPTQLSDVPLGGKSNQSTTLLLHDVSACHEIWSQPLVRHSDKFVCCFDVMDLPSLLQSLIRSAGRYPDGPSMPSSAGQLRQLLGEDDFVAMLQREDRGNTNGCTAIGPRCARATKSLTSNLDLNLQA
jgi:hypothetical protein